MVLWLVGNPLWTYIEADLDIHYCKLCFHISKTGHASVWEREWRLFPRREPAGPKEQRFQAVAGLCSEAQWDRHNSHH